MRILVVSNGFPPRGQWGTEFYTHQLVEGLRSRGHEISVFHPDRTGSKPRYTLERTEAGGVPVWLLHNPGDPRKSFADSYANEEVTRIFRELVERDRPDLVHFTYLLWGLAVNMTEVCRAAGLPVVVTMTDYGLLCHRGQMYDWRLVRCHGPHPPQVCARCIREPSPYDDTPARVLLKRAAARGLAALGGAGRVVVRGDVEKREAAVRRALAAADRLIAPTRVLARAFERFGVDPAQIEELVYSIDPRPFERARPEPAGPMVRFGFLGQFTPHKGLATLLRAVDIMRSRLPESVEPWEVRLYGAPAGGRHRRFAAEMRLDARAPRVRLRPPYKPDRAPEVMADLDVIVLPSEWDENAPLTALQARAAGIPLIASDAEGIREVVEHGVHGLLFPLGDAEALADAMREGVMGRLRRSGHFDLPMPLDEHLDRILAIYARAARDAAARAGAGGEARAS